MNQVYLHFLKTIFEYIVTNHLTALVGYQRTIRRKNLYNFYKH